MQPTDANCIQSVHGKIKISSLRSPKPESIQANKKMIAKEITNVIIAFISLFLTLNMCLRIKKIIEKSITAGIDHIKKAINDPSMSITSISIRSIFHHPS